MIRCQECGYFKQSCKGFVETNILSGNGNKNSEVIIIFDSLFYNDLQSERIASNTEYNKLLNTYLNHINLDIEDVYVTSFIKCYISDKTKKPTKIMKQKCFELYLKKEIEEIKPKVVIVIGRMITQFFIPDVNPRVPLKQIIGKSFLNEEYACQIVPVYDMFYLTNFTNKSFQVKQTERSFACVQSVLKTGLKDKPSVSYSSSRSTICSLGLSQPWLSIVLSTPGPTEAASCNCSGAIRRLPAASRASITCRCPGVLRLPSGPWSRARVSQ